MCCRAMRVSVNHQARASAAKSLSDGIGIHVHDFQRLALFGHFALGAQVFRNFVPHGQWLREKLRLPCGASHHLAKLQVGQVIRA